MDIFIEEMVSRKKDKKDFLKISCMAWGALVLSIVIAILMISVITVSFYIGYMLRMLGPIIIILIWIFAYRMYQQLNVEYEYSIVNSSLDIDKIISKRDRKRVASLDIKDISLMACVDDEENNGEYKGISKNIEVHDCTSNTDDKKIYFIDYTVSGKRQFVLFQPSEKMAKELSRFNTKAVKLYNA